MIEKSVLILINLILIPATLLHIYWILGGEKILDIALPFNVNDKKESLGKITYYSLAILSLAPVIALQCLVLCLINGIVTPVDTYKSIILIGGSMFCIIRALLGWTFMNSWFKNTSFQYYNIRYYSTIFLILGLGFLVLR